MSKIEMFKYRLQYVTELNYLQNTIYYQYRERVWGPGTRGEKKRKTFFSLDSDNSKCQVKCLLDFILEIVFLTFWLYWNFFSLKSGTNAESATLVLTFWLYSQNTKKKNPLKFLVHSHSSHCVIFGCSWELFSAKKKLSNPSLHYLLSTKQQTDKVID